MQIASSNLSQKELENGPMQTNYLLSLVKRQNDELDDQNRRIYDLQNRIDRINERLKYSTELIDKDISNLREEKWKNKVLKIVEDIEKGFAYGYTQRKIKAAANKT